MRIYLDSIGCRLNQSEIEMMAGEFPKDRHTLAEDPADPYTLRRPSGHGGLDEYHFV